MGNCLFRRHLLQLNLCAAIVCAAAHIAKSSRKPKCGDLKDGFQLAKAAVAADAIAHGATDGGAFAVAQAYHVSLVAPFCVAAARSFIAGH